MKNNYFKISLILFGLGSSLILTAASVESSIAELGNSDSGISSAAVEQIIQQSLEISPENELRIARGLFSEQEHVRANTSKVISAFKTISGVTASQIVRALDSDSASVRTNALNLVGQTQLRTPEAQRAVARILVAHPESEWDQALVVLDKIKPDDREAIRLMVQGSHRDNFVAHLNVMDSRVARMKLLIHNHMHLLWRDGCVGLFTDFGRRLNETITTVIRKR